VLANEPGLKRTEAWKKTPANYAGFLYLVIILSVVMFGTCNGCISCESFVRKSLEQIKGVDCGLGLPSFVHTTAVQNCFVPVHYCTDYFHFIYMVSDCFIGCRLNCNIAKTMQQSQAALG
jgi:hypothetical protein